MLSLHNTLPLFHILTHLKVRKESNMTVVDLEVEDYIAGMLREGREGRERLVAHTAYIHKANEALGINDYYIQ